MGGKAWDEAVACLIKLPTYGLVCDRVRPAIEAKGFVCEMNQLVPLNVSQLSGKKDNEGKRKKFYKSAVVFFTVACK